MTGGESGVLSADNVRVLTAHQSVGRDYIFPSSSALASIACYLN